MERKRIKLSILVISLLIIVLSGCGNQSTANQIVESLQEKNYSTAGQIYEEAVQDLSEEKKESLDEAVSNAVIELLEKRYKEAESDNSKEASFYNMLDKIEQEIALDDKELNNKIESYRLVRAEKEKEIEEELNEKKRRSEEKENIPVSGDAVQLTIDSINLTPQHEIEVTITNNTEKEIVLPIINLTFDLYKGDGKIGDEIVWVENLGKETRTYKSIPISKEFDSVEAIAYMTFTTMTNSGLKSNIRSKPEYGEKIIPLHKIDRIALSNSTSNSVTTPTTNDGMSNNKESGLKSGNNSNDNDQFPYSRDELEADPNAPSTNPADYNEDGEYVPSDGVSDNPADYNSNGEYKPAEDMTQEEIKAELEAMFGN